MRNVHWMKFLVMLFIIQCMMHGIQIAKPNEEDIVIGSQVWMKGNLNVTTFRNGQKIKQAKTKDEWKKINYLKQPAWCYFDFDSKNAKRYGMYYNWYAVNDKRGLAPNGYHIPSDVEWKTLSTFAGGDSIAGKYLKSKRGWRHYLVDEDEEEDEAKIYDEVDAKKVSGNGEDIHGFNAKPTGGLIIYDKFISFSMDNESQGYWWTSTGVSKRSAKLIEMKSESNELKSIVDSVFHGYPVRCIKD